MGIVGGIVGVNGAKTRAHVISLVCNVEIPSLKTNDGYIASSFKIEQKTGACHHLSNCFDNLSRSTNTIEHNRLYLDCPGP